jgi:DNA-directed RNA polymerase alpha subunit
VGSTNENNFCNKSNMEHGACPSCRGEMAHKYKETIYMTTSNKNLRICDKGHKYYKSSDCPTCPTCEQERKPDHGFFSLLSAPARRALENNGITSLGELSKYSEKDILHFHGMGPASLPKLRSALKERGLSFRN